MTTRLTHTFVKLALVLGALTLPRSLLAAEHLKVIVPEKDNLQHLVFWFAKAGGLFEREGIELEVVVAPPPRAGGTPPIDGLLERGEVDAAVLAPPVYLRMVAEKAPIVIVANLFANDPFALVVRREVAEERKVGAESPLHDRIVALKGIKVGVPPPAFARFRALLATQGLDSEKDVETTVILARDQNSAFKTKKVDALYVPTPALEKAVVDADGVVLFAQARGELPTMANRQTHVLGVSRRMLDQRRDVVASAVRALAIAEKRIHESQSEVVDALAREFAERDRRELEVAVRIYEPAVPASPEVRAQDLGPAASLLPEGVPRPDLAAIDLAPFVASELAISSAATTTGGQTRTIAMASGLVAVIAFAIVFVMRRRRRRTP